jgi:hypothetical protein
MFHPFAYDDQCRTYLARFSGTLTDQDLVDFKVALRECRRLRGLTAGLQDFTQVESCALTTSETVSRGREPQIMTDQRTAVVAGGVVFGMLRLCSSYHDQTLVPVIVRTLPEAYEVLGLAPCDFHPVALSTPLATA